MSPDGQYRYLPKHSGSLRRRPIERFARALEAEVARGRRFDCLVTTDAELRRLNREYRGKDAATDVLSFPAVPKRGQTHFPKPRTKNASVPFLEHSLGDVAVSAGRARAQAREFGHTVEQEIQILMLHGVLHLLGMDHETDRGRMARAEKRWRAALGLPHGLIERVRA